MRNLKKVLQHGIRYATIRFGGGVAEIRGSIGGTTFSRTRAGAIARNRTKPVNTPSAVRAAVRTVFGMVSKLWRDLTDAQRTNWNTTAVSWPQVNKMGETYTPSGQALFNKLNNSLALAGQTTIDSITPPTAFEIGDFGLDVFSKASGELSVLDSAAAATDQVIVVSATPVVSSGVQNVDNMFKQIAVEAPAASIDVSAGWEAIFGQPITGLTLGDVVWLKIEVLNTPNGDRSVPFLLKCALAA